MRDNYGLSDQCSKGMLRAASQSICLILLDKSVRWVWRRSKGAEPGGEIVS